ncbi:conserved hypothetical protein [Streptomyces pristinaespiralis ATCC 25486]|uniref:Uncharacterized protein n=2 Tax=Streptomyces pristinaespiralis TaxID=38300 RepID=B5HBX4_STRE2|nr:conserved hypothetical protein [Streptomyces pristinaespiralis ATCC 25486]
MRERCSQACDRRAMIPPPGRRNMTLYLGIPLGLMALLVAVSGVAALRSGWLLPVQRKYVVRPHLFGWAQLAIALALVIQVAGAVLVEAGGLRSAVTMAGTAVLLAGVLLIVQAQRPARGR